MATSNQSIFELKPYLQPFPYGVLQFFGDSLPLKLIVICSVGREGEESRAARIAKEVLGTEIDPKQPYGEVSGLLYSR